MNKEPETREELRIPVRCYKCSDGCIHLEYGNAMFTFTPQQFCVLADVIGKVQRELAEKTERSDQPSERQANTFVM